MGPAFPIPIPDDHSFGLHNIPFDVFSTLSGVGLGIQKRAGVAIGDWVLELDLLVNHRLFAHLELSRPLEGVFLEPYLNKFASFSASERTKFRDVIIENLSSAKSALFQDPNLNDKAFVPVQDVQMHIPMRITDYTDAFSSLIHAQNCLHPLGVALPEAFIEYPMTYNGRLSSIKISGTDVVRPNGFFLNEGDHHPTFQPTQQLDFEIELGAFVSKPVESGTTVNARNAADHIFGFVLHNDWSARDIQKYEMPPLGPFHSKGFITTISPWVVTMDALKSSRSGPPGSNSTQIHPMLVTDHENHGVYDIEFSASVSRGNSEAVEIVRTNFADSYWSIPQMIAYQSSSGLGLNTGDLLASGTISSVLPDESKGSKEGVRGTNGCLLEAVAQNHILPSVGGKPMFWLEDGDTLTLDGWFKTADGGRAGFGGLTSLILPAKPA